MRSSDSDIGGPQERAGYGTTWEGLKRLFLPPYATQVGVVRLYPDGYKLDDYTDWRLFQSQLWRNSKVWVDHVCWSVVNAVVLVTFWLIAVVGVWLCLPAWWISETLHGLTKNKLSAVNAATPDIHDVYLPDDGGNKAGGTDLTKCDFDLDNAILFIHLCALVYEDGVILEAALRRWHLEYRVVLPNRDETSTQVAWIVYHSRETCGLGNKCPRASGRGQDFIVILFKGTSPFNWAEWMLDCTMSKIKPHGENLPGMVHEGFYEQIEWPIYLRPVTGEQGAAELPDEWPQVGQSAPSAKEGFECNKRQIQERLGKRVNWDEDQEDSFTPALTFYERVIRKTNWVIQNRFPRQLDDSSEPAIWVAGHSLGAALASIFFSHLLHVPQFPLTISKKALKGGYSFGTPRTGDSRYAKEISRHPCARNFFNVVNANDIVCTVPLGSTSVTQDPRALTNFWHVGTPIRVNYWASLERRRWAGWSNVALNAVCHFVSLPFQVASSGAKLLALFRLPFLGPLFFFADHLPSEYLKHLEAAKEAGKQRELERGGTTSPQVM
jgi:hypothetical protein